MPLFSNQVKQFNKTVNDFNRNFRSRQGNRSLCDTDTLGLKGDNGDSGSTEEGYVLK